MIINVSGFINSGVQLILKCFKINEKEVNKTVVNDDHLDPLKVPVPVVNILKNGKSFDTVSLSSWFTLVSFNFMVYFSLAKCYNSSC